MTETLAYFSNNALYAATIVYALGMLSHVAEWAQARQLPATDATSMSADLVGVSSSSSAAGAPTSTHVLHTYGERWSGRRTHDASWVHRDDAERSDRFGRIGLSLTVLGALIQLVGVGARGLAAERVPWGSMYEFAITGSLAVVVAYLFLVQRYQARWLGLWVTGVVVTLLGIAVLVLYRPVAPLVPALHSYWLVIHVSAAAIAGGAFTVGALASGLYLLRARAEAKAQANPALPRQGFLERAPSAAAMDRVAYRVHAFAFPLWTFA
ncbi:MAG: cytochrome c biogenesis protein, partial [Nocardioidaceae bacterium]